MKLIRRTVRLNPAHFRTGFTLLESMFAATFLAVAVIGISSMFIASSEHSRHQQQMTTAVNLARQLLEEIAALPVLEADGSRNPGPEAGETRRELFDNVDDYDGYFDSTAGSTTVSGRSVQLGDGITYRRYVKVEFRDTPDGVASSTGNFVVVTVTITLPDEQSLDFKRLMTVTSVRM